MIVGGADVWWGCWGSSTSPCSEWERNSFSTLTGGTIGVLAPCPPHQVGKLESSTFTPTLGGTVRVLAPFLTLSENTWVLTPSPWNVEVLAPSPLPWVERFWFQH